MKYIVFDTETGGLDPTTDAIISLGAVVWDSERGRLSDPEFYTVINDPTGAKSPGALRVNGFTLDKIDAEGKKPIEAWLDFVAFCRPHFDTLEPVLLAGHNTGFDVGYLRRLARVSGSGNVYDRVFSHRTVCTMNTTRFLCLAGVLPPSLGGLGQVVEVLGVEKQQAHNALGDARMAADVLTKLIEKVKAT